MASSIRILYVDDEPSLLEIGKLFLEDNGEFTVDTVTSAREALSRMKTERYDAIIADYQMPEMDGIQFLVEVRSHFGPVPFILFTGRGREEIVIAALNSGANFYIQKGGEPVSQFAELSHKIISAVNGRSAETALRESEERLRSFVGQALEGISIVDEEGRIVEWNPAQEKITGMPRHEVIGVYAWDLATRMIPDKNRCEGIRSRMEESIKINPQIRNQYPSGSRLL